MEVTKTKNEKTQNDLYKEFFEEQLGIDIDNRSERLLVSEHSFKAFCLIYLGHHFDLDPAIFHKDLVDVLESEAEEAVEVIGFRGSAKTTFCSLAYPLWLVLFRKYNFIILMNETTTQMKINILSIRKEFEDNDLFQSDFPNAIEPRKNKWSEGELEFANDIYLLGRSRGQKIRGMKYRQYRPQVIIADDLEDLEWVRKKENRDKTERWFNSEVIPAQDELKCKMVLIGNLLHNDALMARIKKRNIYKVMEFPLITDDGVITWKGKYPNQEAVDKKKKSVGSSSAWSREYLLKVISEEDQVIKDSDIHKYPVSILTEKETDGGLRYPIRNGATSVDLAISEKETADYTAIIQGLEVSYLGSNKILIKPHPINRRMDFDTTQTVIKSQHSTMPVGSKLLVEDVAYQKAAIQELARKGLSVKGVRPIADKRARLETASPYIKDGTVLFAEYGCEELIDQLLGFGVEAHDDLCLVKGTKIATLKGDKSIEDIQIGDKIITPFGIRKVLASGITGKKKTTSKIGIRGTYNHPVFVYEKGFVNLDTLVYNDNISKLSFKEQILWKYKNLLYLMERNTNLWEGKRSIILASQIQIKEENILKDCTLRFGNFIIKKQLLKGLKFITKILILLTTTVIIWNVYQLANIESYIVKNIVISKLKMKKSILKKSDRWLQSGINQKKEVNGISKKRPINGKIQKLIKRLAKFVEKNLQHFISIQDIAQETALQQGGEDEIQIITEEIVYNLTIEKDNVYYANGILVGNCDALVYLILELMHKKTSSVAVGRVDRI